MTDTMFHMLRAVVGHVTGVTLQVLPTACRGGGHHPTLQMGGLRPGPRLVSPAQATQPVHGREVGFGSCPKPSSARLWECPPGAPRTASPPPAGWTGPPLSARHQERPAAAFLLLLQHTAALGRWSRTGLGLSSWGWGAGWGGMGSGRRREEAVPGIPATPTPSSPVRQELWV